MKRPQVDPGQELLWAEAPLSPYAALASAITFYPGRVDAAYVDEERVRPQAGDFYGGRITHEIGGPFKRAPGTESW